MAGNIGMTHNHGARLRDEMKNRILILNGGMGTAIQARRLDRMAYYGDRFMGHNKELSGNNDILTLTSPEIISQIHEEYLQAGADIISTNTFGATSIVQAEYGLEDHVYEMNCQAARLARDSATKYESENSGRYRFVAGSIGPTNISLSLKSVENQGVANDLTFDLLKDSYRTAVDGLMKGGVDILLVETIFDTLNSKAAIAAIHETFRETGTRLPVWISVSVTHPGGRTLAGQSLQAFFYSIRHIDPICVGLNCGFGPENYVSYLRELSEIADTAVSVHPNAGLPDENGLYRMEPSEFASQIDEFAREGLVNIAGGCCGTNPEFIKGLSVRLQDVSPRIIPDYQATCHLSGLEPLVINQDSLFINVGERTNVAGSSKFRKLIKESKYDQALKVARQQVEAGAQIIDIGMDSPLLDAQTAMHEFLTLINSNYDISRVPIMIDSSDWDVIETGLKCLPGKGIVNSISLKDGEDEFIRKAGLIKKYGAAVVVMAFDEQGQAVSYERKVEICRRSYRILTEQVGYAPEDIIFDPNILTIATGIEEHNRYALNFLEACKTLKKEFPTSPISGGVSNLSFAFRGNNVIREMMHAVFLYHAIRAGMDMGIVNAGKIELYENIPDQIKQPIEEVIFDRDPQAVDRLVELAANIREQKRQKKKTRDWRDRPAEDRIEYALINGIPDYLDNDLRMLMDRRIEPIGIIDDILMNAMNLVGDYFGSGRMFLPQVLKSAGVMKKAIAILKPHIDIKADKVSQSAGKILLATVKGDVHDIGKNITRLILECNNFDVVDLGVMVPPEKIVDTVISEKPDVIGLSGLISPSLEEMIRVASMLERKGLKIPLMVGGATTSERHTELKIQPVYSGPVVHVRDASLSVQVVRDLIARGDSGQTTVRKDTRADIFDGEEGFSESDNIVPLSHARENRCTIDWNNYNPTPPRHRGILVLKNYPLDKIKKYVRLGPIRRSFDLRVAEDDILKQKSRESLMADASELFERVIEEGILSAHAVIGMFEANSIDDNIEIRIDSNGAFRLICLRQQGTKARKKSNYLCLSDFVAPGRSNKTDYVGAFALTTGFGIEKYYDQFRAQSDEYSAILLKLIADRMAEAFAEHLHNEVASNYWGYDKDTGTGDSKPNGIRPAPGYPSCPDHGDKQLIFKILDAEKHIGMKLTDSFNMIPGASICGWYIAHPGARYFSIGKIGRDQVEDYAVRKNITVDEAIGRLQHILV